MGCMLNSATLPGQCNLTTAFFHEAQFVEQWTAGWEVLQQLISVQMIVPLGEGGTPLYKLYRFVLPQRVWFLSHFGLKTGIDFDHYGLKSGMVFKGTEGVSVQT